MDRPESFPKASGAVPSALHQPAEANEFVVFELAFLNEAELDSKPPNLSSYSMQLILLIQLSNQECLGVFLVYLDGQLDTCSVLSNAYQSVLGELVQIQYSMLLHHRDQSIDVIFDILDVLSNSLNHEEGAFNFVHLEFLKYFLHDFLLLILLLSFFFILFLLQLFIVDLSIVSFDIFLVGVYNMSIILKVNNLPPD